MSLLSFWVIHRFSLKSTKWTYFQNHIIKLLTWISHVLGALTFRESCSFLHQTFLLWKFQWSKSFQTTLKFTHHSFRDDPDKFQMRNSIGMHGYRSARFSCWSVSAPRFRSASSMSRRWRQGRHTCNKSIKFLSWYRVNSFKLLFLPWEKSCPVLLS